MAKTMEIGGHIEIDVQGASGRRLQMMKSGDNDRQAPVAHDPENGPVTALNRDLGPSKGMCRLW